GEDHRGAPGSAPYRRAAHETPRQPVRHQPVLGDACRLVRREERQARRAERRAARQVPRQDLRRRAHGSRAFHRGAPRRGREPDPGGQGQGVGRALRPAGGSRREGGRGQVKALAVALLSLALAAPALAQTSPIPMEKPPPAPAQAPPPAPPVDDTYRVGPEDMLEISVWKEEGLKKETVVR